MAQLPTSHEGWELHYALTVRPSESPLGQNIRLVREVKRCVSRLALRQIDSLPAWDWYRFARCSPRSLRYQSC